MMAARRKQPAIDIPSTRAEAEALVRDYARLEHYAGDVRGQADRKIALAKESRDAELATIGEQQSAIFARLKGWWESTGKDEAKGKRSIEVDGTQIGLRLTNPKLSILNKLKPDAALEWLRKNAPRFIRKKEEIDKDAIIRELRKSGASVARPVLGQQFDVTQKDEFYIAVAPLEKPAVEGGQP